MSAKPSAVSLGLLAFFAIGVGLYPLLYIFTDMSGGLLASKPQEVLGELNYWLAFFTHILIGGLALLVGWSQFFPGIRKQHIDLHRILGKIYLLSVLLSGSAGVALAFFATGGLISALGFGMLGLLWLTTTVQAFIEIRKGKVATHQRWMIRSYALCFAAVTLRLWLPLFTSVFDWGFTPSYQAIAWLCWVPNLAFAEWIIRRKA